MSDFHEPADPKVGMLERRMLYLVHQLTFGDCFVKKPYATILDEHVDRVGKEPSTITFPLGTEETKKRLQELATALKDAGWGGDTLVDLCKRDIDSSHPIWAATEALGDAGIFVPFFHARDKAAVKDTFDDGFLEEAEGWAKLPVHALFSTGLKDYTTPEHKTRFRTLGKAKRAKLIRPITRESAPSGSVMALESDGKKYCCRDGVCEYNGDRDYFCSQLIGGGCSANSDFCVIP